MELLEIIFLKAYFIQQIKSHRYIVGKFSIISGKVAGQKRQTKKHGDKKSHIRRKSFEKPFRIQSMSIVFMYGGFLFKRFMLVGIEETRAEWRDWINKKKETCYCDVNKTHPTYGKTMQSYLPWNDFNNNLPD